jgi:hypothetical protein
MGQDWIPKAEKAIKRRLDRARVELSTPQLFTQEPTCGGRVAAAELDIGAQAAVGEDLVASIEGNDVRLYRGNTSVGRLTAPSAEQVTALTQSPAVATVCDVLPHTEGRSLEVRLS